MRLDLKEKGKNSRSPPRTASQPSKPWAAGKWEVWGEVVCDGTSLCTAFSTEHKGDCGKQPSGTLRPVWPSEDVPCMAQCA